MQYYERSPFLPITDREKLRWPNGARLAIWIVVNVEHFYDDVPVGTTLTVPAKELPDIPNYSWHDYGLRVGVWRMLRLFRELDITGSVALHSLACMQYPQVVKAFAALDWEFVAHGRSGSQVVSGMPEAGERALIGEVRSTIEQHTGKRPIGWLGPSLAETNQTLDLLVEHEFQYVCDWVNDEQPQVLHAARGGEIIAMPYSNEINDIGVFLRRGFTGPDYAQMLRDQFDELYEDSEDTARVLCISLHPYLTGVPFRARHLKAALAYMNERSGAWFASGSQILAAYRTARQESS